MLILQRGFAVWHRYGLWNWLPSQGCTSIIKLKRRHRENICMHIYAQICINIFLCACMYINIHMCVCVCVVCYYRKILENPEISVWEKISPSVASFFYVQWRYQFHASFFQIPFNWTAKVYGQKIRSCCITAVCLVAIQSWASQESSNSIKNKSEIISTPLRLVKPKIIFVNYFTTY